VITRAQRRYAVYGFETTHDALVAESDTLAGDLEVRLIPTPRELGGLCGLALRVREADAERTGEILSAARISWRGPITITDR
jgi:hypothetical protein